MLNNLRFSEKSFPVFLFIIGLLAYGIFMPWLGFYWDDWPVILMGKFFGIHAFSDFYAYDRPLSAWTYMVSLPIVGLRPLAWQLYALLLRCAAGVFFWLTLRRVWPQEHMQAAWMAVIFLVYPVFTLQFISVAFSQHWTCALLYTFSLWAMLNSFREGRKDWLWGVPAVGASALHLWTMEYFAGMEVFRYFLIWLALGSNPLKHQKMGSLVRRAAPYALVLVCYVVWRIFFFHPPQEDPNPVRFLQDLATQPLQGLLALAQIILQDLLYMLVQIWAEALNTSRVILTSKFFFFSVLFSTAVAGLLGLYFSRFASKTTQPPAAPWIRQAVWAGIAAIVLGALPGWMTYRQVLNQPYGNRIAIPALFGLGILTVALLEWAIRDQNRKIILLSIVCGVSLYSHLYTADLYREYWRNQRNFYWQLQWRVPALQPGTLVVSDSEVVLGAGDYSTVSAINLMYAREADIHEMPYWFVNTGQRLRPNEKNRLLAGKGISRSFRSWSFEGSDNGVLLVNNSLDRCLQVLSPGQPENSELSASLVEFLPSVNLDRIILEPNVAPSLPREIFGPEPKHGWCYYYQKANLARQSGDWAGVIVLGEEAQAHGDEPANRSEWLLFIDAYVQAGDFSAAEKLTSRIQARDPRVTGILCAYWLSQATVPAGLRDSISTTLACNQPSSN